MDQIRVYCFGGRWYWSRSHCLLPLPLEVGTREEAKEAAAKLLEEEAERELREMCV